MYHMIGTNALHKSACKKPCSYWSQKPRDASTTPSPSAPKRFQCLSRVAQKPPIVRYIGPAASYESNDNERF